MKHVIVISLILSITFIGSSCNKDEEKKDYTITGRIVQSCSNPVPVANKTLQLLYHGTHPNQIHSKTYNKGSVTTDANGNFNITYSGESRGSSEVLGLVEEVGAGYSTVIGSIPLNKNINTGDVYYKSKITMVYKIKLLGTSTNADTILYDGGSALDRKTVIGPFYNNQVLDTFEFYTFQWFKNGVIGSTDDYSFTWMPKNAKSWTDVNATYNFCSQSNDAIIDLDNPAK